LRIHKGIYFYKERYKHSQSHLFEPQLGVSNALLFFIQAKKSTASYPPTACVFLRV